MANSSNNINKNWIVNPVKKETNKKSKPYLFMFLLLIVYFAVTAFLEEEIAFFDPIYTSLMNNWEYFLTFGCSLLLGVFVLYMAHYYFKVSFQPVYFFFALILFATDVVAIVMFPSGVFVSPNDSSIVYSITQMDMIRHICSWFATLLGLYIVFAIAPKVVVNVRAWDIIFFGLIVFTLVAIVHSYVTEWSIYQQIFSPDGGINPSTAPISFTNNRNTYGFVLLLGILSCAYLHATKKWWWTFFVSLFFFINEFLVISKTVLICSCFFYLCYLIWLYVRSIKQHPIRNNIVLISVFILCLAVGLCANAEINSFFSGVNHFFGHIYYEMCEVGQNTFRARYIIWKTIYSDITNSGIVSLLCGFGDHNLEQLLNVVVAEPHPGPLFYAHSSLMDVFGRLGIVGLVIYVALLVFGLVAIIKSIKNHDKGAWINLFMFLTIVLHGMAETTSFLNFTSKSIIILVMVYIPTLTTRYQNHSYKGLVAQEELAQSMAEAPTKKSNGPASPVRAISVTCFIATLIFGFFIGLIPMLKNITGFTMSNYSLITLLIVAVLLPLFIYEIACHHLNSHSGVSILEGFLTTIFALVGIIAPFFIASPLLPLILGLVGVCMFVLFGIGTKTDKHIVKRSVLSYLVYAFICVLMVSVGHIITKYSGVNLDTRYIAIVSGVIILSLFVSLLVMIIANKRVSKSSTILSSDCKYIKVLLKSEL